MRCRGTKTSKSGKYIENKKCHKPFKHTKTKFRRRRMQQAFQSTLEVKSQVWKLEKRLVFIFGAKNAQNQVFDGYIKIIIFTHEMLYRGVVGAKSWKSWFWWVFRAKRSDQWAREDVATESRNWKWTVGKNLWRSKQQCCQYFFGEKMSTFFRAYSFAIFCVVFKLLALVMEKSNFFASKSSYDFRFLFVDKKVTNFCALEVWRISFSIWRMWVFFKVETYWVILSRSSTTHGGSLWFAPKPVFFFRFGAN